MQNKALSQLLLIKSLQYLREASSLIHEPCYYLDGPVSKDELALVIEEATGIINDIVIEDYNDE